MSRISLIDTHFRKDGRAKKGYRTIGQAEVAIKKDLQKYGHEMRMYHCDLCGKYHLSRRDKNDPYDKEPNDE